jgi:hypothetical protein
MGENNKQDYFFGDNTFAIDVKYRSDRNPQQFGFSTYSSVIRSINFSFVILLLTQTSKLYLV